MSKCCEETPRCWNCAYLSFIRGTGKFSCRTKGMSMPRRLINQYPITKCDWHKFCSRRGIARRKEAGWHLVPTAEEETTRFAPKASYLRRRVNPGKVLARAKAVTFRRTESAVYPTATTPQS